MAQENDNGTTGIGDDDIDQDGRPDAAPSQAETGGSGGAGLTRHEGDSAGKGAGDGANARTRQANAAPDTSAWPAKGQHAATQSGAVGAQDTRAAQAGSLEGTGLGTPETGANQDAGDLAPRGPDAQEQR